MSVVAELSIAGLIVHRLPAFSDNYLWLLRSGTQAIAIDPGDAAVVTRALEVNELDLAAILITHHHPDHVGGVATLIADRPCPVYGASDPRLPWVTNVVGESDRIALENFPEIRVWRVPGHTRSHLAFVLDGAIFVGDTLFGAGCGRVFDGDTHSLYASLQRIASLPDSTRVFCAHEYTRANLAFAALVEPNNTAIMGRRRALADGRPSVPFTLAEERDSNVFLRCTESSVQAAAMHWAKRPLPLASDVFVALREWKNVHG